MAAFAADLRRLRLQAGSPTLSRLQHQTGISRTVISEALSGRALPSERTVDALVRALDGDPGAALARRAQLVRGRGSGTSPVPAAVPDAVAAPVESRRCDALAVAIATFVAGCLVSLASWVIVEAVASGRRRPRRSR